MYICIQGRKDFGSCTSRKSYEVYKEHCVDLNINSSPLLAMVVFIYKKKERSETVL